MVDFPSLTILINTYKRPVQLRDALDNLFTHIRYQTDKTSWLLADDCGGIEFTGKFPDPRPLPTVSTPVNSGWGASANNALRHITTDYVYHQDDDFMLTRNLYLRVAVALMEADPTIGMVRYASLACGEKYTYNQHEIDLSAWLEGVTLSGVGAEPARLVYLTLDKRSPSLYLYSQTPLIYNRKRWFDYYGYFPEGVTLGEGEEKYCHHVKDLMLADEHAPKIVVLPEWIPMHYVIERAHSWQHTEVDKQRAVQA